MFDIKNYTFVFFIFYILSNSICAKADNKFQYPFYVGVTGGYGTTTWEGLVPSAKNQNNALSISTPTYVTEGGLVWGVFAGYEFIPVFALEASYMRYPNAKVAFSRDSLFAFEHDGRRAFSTHTELLSLIAKIMFFVPTTSIRVYSGAGVADVHRYDSLADHWRLSPTFALGVNYNFTSCIMGEFGGAYTAGYGEAELDPSKNYFPFLYSFFLRFAYRF